MNRIKNLKLISLLLIGICTFLLADSSALAVEGVGVTGSFSTFDYKIVQGETIDTPLVNVVFVNNYNHAIQLKVYSQTPDGITIHLKEEIVTVEADGRLDIPIVISAAQDAIPGDYDIYVKAKLIEDIIEGKVNVGSEFALKTKVTVFGEAADVSLDVVDIAGEPIRAIMNLYQIVDGNMVPLAYSEDGTMIERVIPGEYEVIAFWGNYQLVRHRFTVVDGQQYQQTLTAQTVQIYGYAASPVFRENTNDQLATINIRFILHNIYKPLTNGRVVLMVYKNGKLLEQRDIFLFDSLEVKQHNLGLNYVPAQGWEKAEYTFQLEFYVDEHNEGGEITSSILYASSLPAILDVSGLSFKKISEFFDGKLILIVLLAAVLAGLFFLIRYLMQRARTGAPKSPVSPKPLAGGKRSCPDCGGQGAIVCPVCGGKGKTMYGTVEEECIYCDGLGEVECDTCINHRHLAVCPKCGDKKYTMQDRAQTECTYCNGLGHVVSRQYSRYVDSIKMKLGKKNK